MDNSWYKISSDEEGTINTDISAEEMISSHFGETLKLLNKRCVGFKDEEDRESVYKELVSTVDGILKVLKEIEGEEKIKIQKILDGFKVLANEKFKDLLIKDLEEIKKAKEAEGQAPELEAPPMSEEAPAMPPMTEPLQEVASFKNSFMRFASVKNISKDKNVKKEMLEEYSTRICKAIQNCGIEFIAKVDPKNNEICLIDRDANKILIASFNDKLLLTDLSPVGKYSKIYPVSSLKFYQRFFKPIVDSLGHFFIDEFDTLFLSDKSSLPNMSKKEQVSELSGYDTLNKKDTSFELHFCGKPLTWLFKEKKNKLNKEAQTRTQMQKKIYTEDDFTKGSPIRVKCIDPDLQSIYAKIGEVVQVIPCSNHIELDINFGRKIVRLTNNQIEKLNEI